MGSCILSFLNRFLPRLTADARFFVDSLGQLEGVKSPGHELEKYVEELINHANAAPAIAT